MKKFLGVTQLTQNKWLNLFVVKYLYDDNKVKNYYFASRRNLENLSINNFDNIDAVRILPYLKEAGKTYVVIIKEFRHAINDYIYSTPAGLIEAGETPEAAAIRELEEEIGASVVKIKRVLKPSFSSAGLTDERVESYEAEIKLDKFQKLDENEEISFFKVNVDQLLNFIDSHKFGSQSALMLKCFYYKNKLNEHLEQI